MAQRVTIDRLAEMVMHGFQDLQDEMRRGFAAIDARFAAVDARLDQMDGRLDRVERKLDGVIERVDDHEVRLTSLEGSA